MPISHPAYVSPPWWKKALLAAALTAVSATYLCRGVRYAGTVSIQLFTCRFVDWKREYWMDAAVIGGLSTIPAATILSAACPAYPHGKERLVFGDRLRSLGVQATDRL